MLRFHALYPLLKLNGSDPQNVFFLARKSSLLLSHLPADTESHQHMYRYCLPEQKRCYLRTRFLPWSSNVTGASVAYSSSVVGRLSCFNSQNNSAQKVKQSEDPTSNWPFFLRACHMSSLYSTAFGSKPREIYVSSSSYVSVLPGKPKINIMTSPAFKHWFFGRVFLTCLSRHLIWVDSSLQYFSSNFDFVCSYGIRQWAVRLNFWVAYLFLALSRVFACVR
jgi:hypothetical protein